MEILGEVLTFAGTVAILLGSFGIAACAYADGLWRGLAAFIFPPFGIGSAMRRWPWVVWLWGGGIVALALVSVLHLG